MLFRSNFKNSIRTFLIVKLKINHEVLGCGHQRERAISLHPGSPASLWHLLIKSHFMVGGCVTSSSRSSRKCSEQRDQKETGHAMTIVQMMFFFVPNLFRDNCSVPSEDDQTAFFSRHHFFMHIPLM